MFWLLYWLLGIVSVIIISAVIYLMVGLKTRKIPVGARVFIFETVTPYEWGERGTVEEFKDGRYIVRADDGALFSQTPDGVRLLNSH